MSKVAAILITAASLSFAGVALAQNADTLKPAIVKITAQAEGKRKIGTGFIVRLEADAAYVVTASHVVEGDAQPRLEFFVQRNKPVSGEVVKQEGGDPKGLALLVLRAKPPAGLSALVFAPSASLTGGEAVTAIGFGQGQGDWGVINAFVTSQEGRDLRLNGSIEEGNSGGPVLKAGKVVGLITSVERAFALATPSNFVEFILKNWGVKVASVEGEPKSSAASAAEDLAKSQTGALDAITKALDESVTKPIAAANTANTAVREVPNAASAPARPEAPTLLGAAGASSSLSLSWLAGKWEGRALATPGGYPGDASYIEVKTDGSFLLYGKWVGRRRGKLQISAQQISYVISAEETGRVIAGTDGKGADTLLFEGISPSLGSPHNRPLLVELKRKK